MKWFVRNIKLITYGSYILVAIALIIAIMNNFYTTQVALVCGVFLIVFTVLMLIIQNNAINKAKQALNERCDPEEYLEVTGALYKANPKLPLRIVCYCQALSLSDLKNYKIVRQALEQILKSYTAITSKYVEALFYVVLCDVYIYLEEYSNAEICYKRSYSAYEGIKSAEQTEEIKDLLLVCLVELLVHKGDIERAEMEYNNIEEKNKKQKLEKLYLSALIEKAKGNEETATASLEIVASKANKLSLVEKAEIMLGIAKKDLTSDEQDLDSDDESKEEANTEVAIEDTESIEEPESLDIENTENDSE